MGDGFQFLDIILLAMVAGFIALRLRSVLGRRTGSEPRQKPPTDTDESVQKGEVLPFPDSRKQADLNAILQDGPAASGLSHISAADRNFNPVDFMGGAKAAYQMIVESFAKGDTAALRPLLSDSVYQHFARAIADRAPGSTAPRSPHIRSAEFVDASLKGPIAEITIKFVSDLNDDKNAPEEIIDIWTFSRDITSSDPNWALSATAAIN